MSIVKNSNLSHAASQLMAIELVSGLLVSTSPHKLGEVLTEHLRELSGARTVMVLAHRPEPEMDELLHVSPLRRADLFSTTDLALFCFEKTPGDLPYFTEELPERHPLKFVLHKVGIQSMARFELRAGGELVGLLLLFDLPGVDRIAETNQIITLLAPPIALALKNALSYFQIEQQSQELEKRVQDRTAELHRKNVELLKSEERHRTILQTAMEGFWLVNADKNILEVNDAYCLMSGYSRQELQGMHITDLEATDTEKDIEARAKKIMEQGGDRFESRHRRKDGNIIYVEVSIKFLPLEGGSFAVFIHDITERKQAEEAMRLSENRLRYALEGTNDGLWDVQLKSGKTYISPRGCEILGYREDELYDLLKVWSDLVHPDDMPITEERLQAHINGQAPIFEVEQRLRTKSGVWKWIYTRGKVVERDLDGVPLRITGTHSDITEKKMLEGQLQQAQKMESVGRLAGGVAHDFNNLLTVILGNAQLGMMKLDPAHPANSKFEEIRKAAEKSADLTRQLLGFARKQTIAPQVIDLNETVENMLKMLRRLIGEDIHLVWQSVKNVWQIKVDPSQIDQILANLCVNARDAIADVGKITIETGNCTFDEDYCAANFGFIPGEYVLLAVSDDGCGMDKETKSQIFEPFFTTKGIGEGTGLGLAMVYGIVKQNNGFINVYSEPGQGTTFKIYLPRHDGEDGLTRIENSVKPLSRGQETILLVEDEPVIRVVTTTMLEIQGYNVLAASTPGEAIKIAKKHADEIHLLMTDVVMPEMNGRDLARTLLPICPKSKCLFMSGYTANVIAHHGVLDENVNFISKPFSLPGLAAKVREVLDGKSGNK